MTIGQMRIIDGLSYDAMSAVAAGLMMSQLNLKANSNLALPWGISPKGMYKLLSHPAIASYDFYDAKVFALDDVIGSRQIGQEQLHEQLFNNIVLKPENRFNPAAVPPDEYDALIDAVGGIDLLYLGLGLNGHLAFNEPGTPFDTRTHKVQLQASTIEDCKAKYQINVKDGITMGLATMMKAKQVVLLISGENKREISRQAVYGEVTTRVPASILQLHQNVTVLVDFEL